MTHVSLFSGIGGIDLAAEWAGFRTVLFCEQDKYCQKVLKQHWPSVPIIEDVKNVNSESVSEPVTLISGGFPCQPYSVAGKRRGKEDDRYLWPEMLRVIQELKPTWALCENVPGFVSMGLEDALSDLESAGYEAQSFLIPACGIGAPHQRYRVFIVANSRGQRTQCVPTHDKNKDRWAENRAEFGRSSQDMADTERNRREQGSKMLCGRESIITASCENVSDPDKQYGNGNGFSTSEAPQFKAASLSKEHWLSEPDVGRVAHGIPKRVDRLKCLGNAVVPQQVYPILRAIAEIEGDK